VGFYWFRASGTPVGDPDRNLDFSSETRKDGRTSRGFGKPGRPREFPGSDEIVPFLLRHRGDSRGDQPYLDHQSFCPLLAEGPPGYLRGSPSPQSNQGNDDPLYYRVFRGVLRPDPMGPASNSPQRGPLLLLLRALYPLGGLGLLSYLAYRFVPIQAPSRKASLWGAIFCVIAFGLLSTGFHFFVNPEKYDRLYGSLGT